MYIFIIRRSLESAVEQFYPHLGSSRGLTLGLVFGPAFHTQIFYIILTVRQLDQLVYKRFSVLRHLVHLRPRLFAGHQICMQARRIIFTLVLRICPAFGALLCLLTDTELYPSGPETGIRTAFVLVLDQFCSG